MSEITYEDKADLVVDTGIDEVFKVTASDMNEIKNVVNGNAEDVGDISTLTTTDKTSVVSAINELETDKLETSAVVNEASTETDEVYSSNYLNNKLVSVGAEAPTDGASLWVQPTTENLLDYRNFQTRTYNGIDIVNNHDGTFTINGTATAEISAVISDAFLPMSGTWRMLGCPSGGSSSTYMLSAYVGYWGGGSPNIDTGSGTNITYTGNVKIRFYIKSGTTCNNLVFKPMLTTNTSATINDFAPKGPNIYALINGQYQVV